MPPAWPIYITHSLAGHVQPFFAPIAAAVSIDLRGKRVLQLMLTCGRIGHSRPGHRLQHVLTARRSWVGG